jgi:cell division protein FtsB
MGKLNGMIENYKLDNDKNIIKISNLSSLENIEKTAINEYNMVKPEKIQYLLNKS